MDTFTLYRNEWCNCCRIDSVHVFREFDQRHENSLITKCTICGEIFYLDHENKTFTSRLTGKKMMLDEVIDIVWKEDIENEGG